MADVKISALPAVTTCATTDIFALVQGGVTYRGTLAQMILAIPDATGSTRGILSSTDWTTFNNKLSAAITSLGGLTGASQTLATGTTGTDFTISSVGTTHTFNLPDASATARGLVTTGSQTIAGAKTFSSAPTLTGFTAGSVLFAGTGGLVSQDNANLFWDDANNQLILGSTTSYNESRLTIQTTPTVDTVFIRYNASDINASVLNLGKSRGTTASPTAVITNDRLGFYTFSGYEGTDYRRSALIAAFAANNYAANSHGSYLSFIVTAVGQAFSNRRECLRLFSTGNITIQNGGTFTDAGFLLDVNGTARVQGDLTISTKNIITDTTTGTKIGTATGQKISLWNATPDIQPTTAITASAFVANTSGIVDDTATFGGYTIGQVVAALKRLGVLA